MYALFDGLDRMDSSTNWIGWQGTAAIKDNDANYGFCFPSNQKVGVKTGTC